MAQGGLSVLLVGENDVALSVIAAVLGAAEFVNVDKIGHHRLGIFRRRGFSKEQRIQASLVYLEKLLFIRTADAHAPFLIPPPTTFDMFVDAINNTMFCLKHFRISQKTWFFLQKLPF